jgi:hypothetical protein
MSVIIIYMTGNVKIVVNCHEYFPIIGLHSKLGTARSIRFLAKAQRAAKENPADAEFDLAIKHSERIHERPT